MIRSMHPASDRRSADRAIRAGRFGFRGVVELMRRNLRRRVAERALSELDDHLLRDIGLTRSQIRAAAFGLLPRDGD